MYIHVKIRPKSKKEKVYIKDKAHFEIDLKEEAKNNQANIRLIQILKEHFKTNAVKIVNGHHSRTKLISITLNK